MPVTGVQDCTSYTASVEDHCGECARDPAGPRSCPVLGNHDYKNPGAGLSAHQDYFSYVYRGADPQGR